MGHELRKQLEREVVVAAIDPEVLLDGQLHQHRPLLGDQSESSAHSLVQRRGRRFAVQHHLPAEDREFSRHRQQRRALAGAVGTEQRDHFGGMDLQVKITDDPARTVAGHQSACLEHRLRAHDGISGAVAGSVASACSRGSPR